MRMKISKSSINVMTNCLKVPITLTSMQTVWDPLRKKEVALTPEERVRQWFIAFLMKECDVPISLMNSEVALEYGRKRYRADIVVCDREGKPLLVVECKREDVELGAETIRQALRYHAVLDIKYIVLTNGKSTFLYGRNAAGEFIPLREFPKFEQML